MGTLQDFLHYLRRHKLPILDAAVVGVAAWYDPHTAVVFLFGAAVLFGAYSLDLVERLTLDGAAIRGELSSVRSEVESLRRVVFGVCDQLGNSSAARTAKEVGHLGRVPEMAAENAATHRVLLDALKPDWWVKLREMMQEFEQAQATTGSDILEDRASRIDREYSFLEHISELPLHAVDPRFQALVRKARTDHELARTVRHLATKVSPTDRDREDAVFLLRGWEQFMERVKKSKADDDGASSLQGQHDLVMWFLENVNALEAEQFFWRAKLRELAEPQGGPTRIP